MNRKKEFLSKKNALWDRNHRYSIGRSSFSTFYHQRLNDLFSMLVPPGKRVLEIGCGTGNTLFAANPATGIGIDFSEQAIFQAKHRFQAHSNLSFIHDEAVAGLSRIDTPIDYIILSDLLNDIWDVQELLEAIYRISTPTTRLILNVFSHLWEIPLKIAQKSGCASVTQQQNWLTIEDIAGLMALSNWEILKTWQEVLLPVGIPGITSFCNQVLVKFPPFAEAALTNFVIARPLSRPQPKLTSNQFGVSIAIPARNEEGNIPGILQKIPLMGRATEIIFVEGNSTDSTRRAIQREIAANPSIEASCWNQTGSGKGDAVRLAFSKARYEILMILDADLTVPPSSLPRFFEALVSGKGDFINGVRLVYPMEKESMQFLNLIANKFFGKAFSWILGQPVKDTLCGTKVLWKKDYESIVQARSFFGELDPFGDFDLLFGASRQNLKILDLPIRYQERVYGQTNIDRWRHGLLLFRMLALGLKRLKCI